tara:strand:- start:3723 stop:9722 length:6000 start_codon:yes stop_codon:yes gene_type:complete
MPDASTYFLSDAQANITGFREKPRNIPFYAASSADFKVKILFNKFDDTANFLSKMPQVKRSVINKLMLHFFPEFYINLRADIADKDTTTESESSPDSSIDTTYYRIRDSMKDSITAFYYTPHNPLYVADKNVVVASMPSIQFPLTKEEVETLKEITVPEFRTHTIIEALRIPGSTETTTFITQVPQELTEILGFLKLLPSMDESMQAFNADNGVEGGNGSTAIVIGSMIENNNLINDAMATFHEQLNGFPGALPINLDFNGTQQTMMKVLTAVVGAVTKDLTSGYDPGSITYNAAQFEFSDADILEFEFGYNPKGVTALAGISYVVNEVSFGRRALRTGYMTNVLYNPRFSDPLTLATLKNYNVLVGVMTAAAGFFGGTDISFTDFLSSTPPGDFGLDSNFTWDDLPKPAETKNPFLQEAAKQGVIDLGDVKNLENGFKLVLTPKEMRALRIKVRENPEVYKKVMLENKKKNLKTAMNVAEGIEGVMNGNFPGVKKDSKLGALLRQIGIDELAKEAMLCLTFGLAPAFARIASAVKGAIREQGLSLYQEPTPAEPSMTMPEIDLSFFKMFTMDGDLWPQILKIMLDTLMESVLEIVKALAELLGELCKINNPRADDFGANDLSELIEDNLDSGLDLPNISNQSALERLCEKQGMSLDDMMRYFSDLSPILSSMEICFLFTDRNSLTYETIQKILDFNLQYHDLRIRSALNTYTSLLGFFASLSRFVDMSSFCNEIATEVFNANIDNLCLLEEAAPGKIDETLQKIAEEGVRLDNPGGRINLDCPLRDDYINNPLVSDTIPQLLDTIAEIVEVEFVNSVGSAQQVLKEPKVVSDGGTKVLSDTINHASGIGEGAEELSNVAKNILSKMMEVFASIGGMLDELEEHCDVGEILGVPVDTIEDVVQVVVDMMTELLNSSEFTGAIGEIENRLSEISGAFNEPGGASALATSYAFPRDFKRKFIGYLRQVPDFNPVATTDMDNPVDLVKSNEFYSRTPSLASSMGVYSTYRSPELVFKLPERTPATWVLDESEVDTTDPKAVKRSAAYSRLKIPRYVQVAESEIDGDRLVIRYPSPSQVNGNKFVDVSLESKLLPTGSAPIYFSINDPIAGVENEREANPYASLFTDALINGLEWKLAHWADDAPLNMRAKRQIDTVLFPSLFAGQVEATFNYIQSNGIFDIDRLNSLNFFHDNRNCLPEDVADLLDIDGILEELQNEMLDALCFDAEGDNENPMGAKIRSVIQYGMFLLLIQIHVAQFIIKNIFVFAAFEIDEIFETPLVTDFMSITIREQVAMTVRSQPMISSKMVAYFNKKLARKPAKEAGGLLNSLGEIVFPAGKQFDSLDFPAIIEYAAGERIFRSRLKVSNAVKNASSETDPKGFSRAFIEDILTVQPGWLAGWDLGQGHQSNKQRIIVPQVDGLGEYYSPRDMLEGSEVMDLKHTYEARLDQKLKEPALKTLPYGKLVLERQVVWDSVEGIGSTPVPTILEKTAGPDYGLELSLFKSVLFDPTMRLALEFRREGGYVADDVPESVDLPELRFNGLAMKYNIVYYYPTQRIVHNTTDDAPGENMFYKGTGGNLAAKNKLRVGKYSLDRSVLARLDTAVPLANTITTTETSVQNRLLTVDGETRYVRGPVPVLDSQLLTYAETLTESEFEAVRLDEVFIQYFEGAFNHSLTSLVPIMHNFYLTSTYFPKFDRLLGGPKARCIQIFVDSVLNENAVVAPSRRNPQAEAAAAGGSPEDLADLLGQSAIDFILKMLIETPINILRGVSETMDPHVALSKLIRDLTGYAFNQAAKVIDATPPIGILRDGGPPDEDGNPAPAPLAPNLSGEGVMELLFCVLALAMKAAQKGFVLSTDPIPPSLEELFPPPIAPDSMLFLNETIGPFIGNPLKMKTDTVEGSLTYGLQIPAGGLEYKEDDEDPRDPRNNVPEEIRDNIMPKISIEGVDFTGTLLGLLMLPPGPFGIVYLLLMLLKKHLEEALEDALLGEDDIDNVSEEETGSEC